MNEMVEGEESEEVKEVEDTEVAVEVEVEKEDDRRSEVESSEEGSETEEEGMELESMGRVVLLDVAGFNKLKIYCRNCNSMKISRERTCPTCLAK